MSLASGALLQDEIILGRLFVASNGFPIFALPKAITRRFAIPTSKAHYALSILRSRHCVVRLFGRRHRTGRCRIFLRDSEERKRDRLPASGERFGCGGWI